MTRLWAWLSLLAAAGVAASLAWLLIQNWHTLLLALAAIAVAITAAWLAVAHHGPARWAYTAVAVLAAVAGAALVVARGAVDELLLFAASAVLFTLVARRALAPPARPLPRGRPARGILILNPKSGGGKVERFDLLEEAHRRGIETVVLEPGDDLHELAVASASREPPALGMAGGDGSQALVADVAAAHGIPYVCVAAGTRNHLALDLGLDVEDVAGGLDAFAEGIVRSIDLAYANDRVFVNNVSIGVYAEVVQSGAYRDAKLKTALGALPGLIGPSAVEHHVSFVDGYGAERPAGTVLLVSNNPYELHRPFAAGARLRLDTGVLGIALVQAGRTLTLRQWTAATFEVWADSPIVAAIDGEAVTLEERIHFRSEPGALTVLLPPNADLTRGLRLQRPTALIRTLARVAAGREDALVPS